MKSESRKEREKKELREKILKAAQRIVLKGGADALTMRRVADAIEYAPGTLYLYFRNREAILHALGRMGLERLLGYLLAAPAAASAAARVQALATAYLAFAADEPETYRLIFMLDSHSAEVVFSHPPGDEATDPGLKAYGLLVHAFSGLGAQVDPVGTAELFWITLHGIASLKIACGKFLQTDTVLLAQRASASICLAPVSTGARGSAQ